MTAQVCPRLVVVIDDDEDVRDALMDALTDADFKPLGASNGANALDRLRALDARPCLILLDVMMPEMDGWEFRAAQRRDPALAEIPVVVLTAHADARQAAASMQAAGFLRKPVSRESLLATVGRFCQPRGDDLRR